MTHRKDWGLDKQGGFLVAAEIRDKNMLGTVEQFHSLLISILSKWRTQKVYISKVYKSAFYNKKKMLQMLTKLKGAVGYMSQQIFRGCEEMAEV